MLQKVLEVFFMGQIIFEKLDEEIKVRVKDFSEQMNNGKHAEEWRVVDNAIETVKTDYEQAYNALQELLRSTGNLACVFTQTGLPMLAAQCNAAKQMFEKVGEQANVSSH